MAILSGREEWSKRYSLTSTINCMSHESGIIAKAIVCILSLIESCIVLQLISEKSAMATKMFFIL
ncbi:MAG: hypothetical protein K1X82_14210 [Bacteroidia bacterium]|nr:hypothetical protein [Bacteroidia bacterium]